MFYMIDQQGFRKRWYEVLYLFCR